MKRPVPKIVSTDSLHAALKDTANQGGVMIVDSAISTLPAVTELAAMYDLDVVMHSGEPKEAQVDAIAEQIRSLAVDGLVMAVGGGAVLDAGKAAASIAASSEGAAHYQLGANPMPLPKHKVVCVPTTSGTGSEVTRVSIVGDNEGQKKWMYGDALWPDLVLLDPSLTHSVPPMVKKYCGLDAFVHALEAASGKNSSPEIIAQSEPAISTILDSLADSIAGDKDADAQMQMASLQAGRAIDLGGTTIGHCIGHALGTVCGLPHGLAVALATDVTLEASYHATPEAFAALEKAIDRGTMVAQWRSLVERVGSDGLTFATSASPSGVLASALSAENQPMRNTNVHWFGDSAIADVIQRLFQEFAR